MSKFAEVLNLKTQNSLLTAANKLLQAEVDRVHAVLAEWEQNQLEATEDAYDAGYYDGKEGREHRNTTAMFAALGEQP